MKNIEQMSDEELSSLLVELRANRKSGYGIQKRSKRKDSVPKLFANLDEDMAARILEELLNEDSGDGNEDEDEDEDKDLSE
uniref:Uncharacterized protein n=1 Tax=viral metagenome TaxID=1070528 RepID=A0A6M3LZL4_9ZZZZ